MIHLFEMKSGLSAGLLALLALSSLVAPAQQRPKVNVPFFVVDHHGTAVPHFTRSSVEIFEDKRVPQSPVEIHTGSELPLRLGVLIDVSRSVASDSIFKPLVESIPDFVYHLMTQAEDRVFIVTFSDSVESTSFQTREQFANFKLQLTPKGGTALYDAVHSVSTDKMELDANYPLRRVLIVVSDGGDNQSQHTREEAIRAAQRAGTVIFTISTKRTESDLREAFTLTHLADDTGGARIVGLSPRSVANALSEVGEQIANMCVATYVPPAPDAKRQHHAVTIKSTSDKNLRFRAPGYR